jgi:hypothetical protein
MALTFFPLAKDPGEKKRGGSEVGCQAPRKLRHFACLKYNNAKYLKEIRNDERGRQRK